MGMLLWVLDDFGDGSVLLVVVSRQLQGRWCKTYVPFWGLVAMMNLTGILAGVALLLPLALMERNWDSSIDWHARL